MDKNADENIKGCGQWCDKVCFKARAKSSPATIGLGAKNQ
jgi:hypothetical protein